MEKIEVEKSAKDLGKREKVIIEDPRDDDSSDNFEEEAMNEDIEEISLENDNEEKQKELMEKEAKKKQSLEDSIIEELAKSSTSDELVVYVDSREGNSRVIRALDTIGVKVKVNTMAGKR